MKYSVAFVAAFAGFAAAQSGTASAPVPTSSISPCILTCSQQAASSAGCSSFTDLSCVCSSTDFQTAAASCITQQCPDQVQQALQLQQALCGAAGSGSSAVASATSSAATATAPASSSSATSVTSRVSGSSASHASSVVGSASSLLSSLSSAVASATSSPNAAAGLPSFNFAAAGLWTAVALGGVAVAQLAL